MGDTCHHLGTITAFESNSTMGTLVLSLGIGKSTSPCDRKTKAVNKELQMHVLSM